MGTQDPADSIYSSQRSLLSEVTRQDPPQLLYENLHPDFHDDDALPPSGVSGPSDSIRLGSQGSDPAHETPLSPRALLTSTVLATIADSRDSKVAGWIAEMQYNSLGGGVNGANSWAIYEDGVVVGPIGAYELFAVGAWCAVKVLEYPADDDDVSAGDGEGLMDWEMVGLDGI